MRTLAPVLVTVFSTLQLAGGSAKADDAPDALKELRRIQDQQSHLIKVSRAYPGDFEIKSLDASSFLDKFGIQLGGGPDDIRAALGNYVIWLENMSSSALRVVVHSARKDAPDVSSMEGTFARGQMLPFILGTCPEVLAYIVQVFIPARSSAVPVMSTPVISPGLGDGNRCADLYGIRD